MELLMALPIVILRDGVLKHRPFLLYDIVEIKINF
jgi:hypothetical protein